MQDDPEFREIFMSIDGKACALRVGDEIATGGWFFPILGFSPDGSRVFTPAGSVPLAAITARRASRQSIAAADVLAVADDLALRAETRETAARLYRTIINDEEGARP